MQIQSVVCSTKFIFHIFDVMNQTPMIQSEQHPSSSCAPEFNGGDAGPPPPRQHEWKEKPKRVMMMMKRRRWWKKDERGGGGGNHRGPRHKRTLELFLPLRILLPSAFKKKNYYYYYYYYSESLYRTPAFHLLFIFTFFFLNFSLVMHS